MLHQIGTLAGKNLDVSRGKAPQMAAQPANSLKF